MQELTIESWKVTEDVFNFFYLFYLFLFIFSFFIYSEIVLSPSMLSPSETALFLCFYLAYVLYV